jgi:2-C-methyl-D-erythritol 4-phosphate cytidylyltransferase
VKEIHKHTKVIAIVPAAGMGKRFGPGTKKPFQNLSGKPLIVWSLEALESVNEIEEVIPVLMKEDMEYGRRVFEEYGLRKVKMIAPGGKERQDSVYNGLRLIEDKKSIVLIHDGVRPLIEKELIEKGIMQMQTSHETSVRESQGFDGIVLGVPVKDTIKELEAGFIRKTLKRESLWAIQTPQIFHLKNILNAYEKAAKEGFYSTDDSALLERYGGKVKVIDGSYRNIKITTPEDLEIAEVLLNRAFGGNVKDNN